MILIASLGAGPRNPAKPQLGKLKDYRSSSRKTNKLGRHVA
jgi:hypothetical protein